MFKQRQINQHIELGILDLKAFATLNAINVKRDLEKAGTRFVLQQLLKSSENVLTYTEHNKPVLRGRHEHISISHSHDKLAVILNKVNNTGIDIELKRDKILNIRHKFLNQNESEFAGSDVDKLLTIWAAKEAMYKFYGLKELDFISHLSVESFTNEKIVGAITKGNHCNKLSMIAENVDDYKMVYILNEL